MTLNRKNRKPDPVPSTPALPAAPCWRTVMPVSVTLGGRRCDFSPGEILPPLDQAAIDSLIRMAAIEAAE